LGNNYSLEKLSSLQRKKGPHYAPLDDLTWVQHIPNSLGLNATSTTYTYMTLGKLLPFSLVHL
jgi:hypothetical protein